MSNKMEGRRKLVIGRSFLKGELWDHQDRRGGIRQSPLAPRYQGSIYRHQLNVQTCVIALGFMEMYTSSEGKCTDGRVRVSQVGLLELLPACLPAPGMGLLSLYCSTLHTLHDHRLHSEGSTAPVSLSVLYSRISGHVRLLYKGFIVEHFGTQSSVIKAQRESDNT